MTGAGTSQTITVMGTCATIQVVGDDGDARNIADREAAIARAFGWFRRIEECCSRFEPGSEVSKLAFPAGQWAAFTRQIYAQECDAAYRNVFDSYWDDAHSIYNRAA